MLQHEAIIAYILDPSRLEKYSQVAKATHNLGTIDEAKTMVIYEAQFFGARLAAIDLNKHQLAVEIGANIFLEVIQAGMSFSSEANHIYLQPNFQNSKKLDYYTTPEGDIYRCQRAGSINHTTKTVMVYEGEPFKFGTNNEGKQIILHQGQLYQQKPPIVAGYFFIVFSDGSREPYWMDMADVDRLKKRSRGKNGGPNELYSSFNGGIDPGFFGAKLIKHGLKDIRKTPIYGAAIEDDVDLADITPGHALVQPAAQSAPQQPAFQSQPPQVQQSTTPQYFPVPQQAMPMPHPNATWDGAAGVWVIPPQFQQPPKYQPANANHNNMPF